MSKAIRNGFRRIKLNPTIALPFIIGILVFILCTVTNAGTRKKVTQELTAHYEAVIADLKKDYETEFIKAYGLNEEPERDLRIEEEAKWVAKVLYGTANNNSEAGQRMTVWCIINRVENGQYPDTIKDVCEQKSQWMQYSDKNPVVKNLLNIAYEELYKWHCTDVRPMSPSFVFLGWSSNSITLRNTFEEEKSTVYFKESDW